MRFLVNYGPVVVVFAVVFNVGGIRDPAITWAAKTISAPVVHSFQHSVRQIQQRSHLRPTPTPRPTL